jgi:hypothetical protein
MSGCLLSNSIPSAKTLSLFNPDCSIRTESGVICKECENYKKEFSILLKTLDMIIFKGKEYPKMKATLSNLMEANRTAFNEAIAAQMNEKFGYNKCSLHPDFTCEIIVDVSPGNEGMDIIRCCCDDFKNKIVKNQFDNP